MSTNLHLRDPEKVRNYLIARKLIDQTTRTFPWYDSIWLRKYVAAKKMFEHVRPNMLPEFINAFDRLRTRPDFAVRQIDSVFNEQILEKIRDTIKTLPSDALESHETENFGRLVVHNHPFFTKLQKDIQPLVSGLAGELVEPSYNFLSLYSQLGVCHPHIDSPEAKWTLDLCIDQSEAWPIHFSGVVPWPEDFSYPGEDWQTYIKERSNLQFTSYCLQPNEAVLFSGSSQWHYREGLSNGVKSKFCTLLFFHFIPDGMGELVRPKKWPEIFGLPELEAVVNPNSAFNPRAERRLDNHR